jgi:hypothetical protein
VQARQRRAFDPLAASQHRRCGSGSEGSRQWHWYDRYYVTAGSKKYFVLRDSEKTPLANPPTSYGALSVEIPKGGTYIWYAKYQAPPAEVKKINYYTPISPPFEDISITD